MSAWRALAGAAAGLLLAGCEVPAPRVDPPPAVPGPPEASPPPPARGGLDSRLEALYAGQERRLLAQGLLRRDGGGPDSAFDAEALTRDFVEIALFDEYRETASGQLVQSATSSQLRRWAEPVRIGVTFGAGVPEATRRKDLEDIARYAERLSRAADHPVELTDPADANFHVLVLGETERLAAAPQLRALVPRISDASIRTATDIPRSIYCLALAFSEPGRFTYAGAIAIVRAEHPDLTRLSCYHEEIAQGLGLANDSPTARPSIFNDDEEFALLTWHDELLLRILYDPRLTPGMTAVQAAPVVRRIAEELLPGPRA